MKKLLFILLYIWQMPQNLLGLLLFQIKAYKPLREIEYRGRRVLICDEFPGGISLGHYVLIDFNRQMWDDAGHQERVRMKLQDSIKHEALGHSRQSEYLGPLYLPIIGVCSGIHAAIHNYRTRRGLPVGNYYKFWPEAWADRLAGIVRQ